MPRVPAFDGRGRRLGVHSAAMSLRRSRVLLAVAVLAPASVVLVHDLSFLAEFGPSFRAALRATGHDDRWASTVAIVLAVSTLLVSLALARLTFLWLKARSLERIAGNRSHVDAGAYLRLIARTWPSLAVVTAVIFLVQENIERLTVGEPLPGLEPLVSGPSARPIEILALVSLALAALGALLLWGHTTLVARIEAAHRRSTARGRAPLVRRPIVPTSRALRPPASVNLAQRAPPSTPVSQQGRLLWPHTRTRMPPRAVRRTSAFHEMRSPCIFVPAPSRSAPAPCSPSWSPG